MFGRENSAKPKSCAMVGCQLPRNLAQSPPDWHYCHLSTSGHHCGSTGSFNREKWALLEREVYARKVGWAQVKKGHPFINLLASVYQVGDKLVSILLGKGGQQISGNVLECQGTETLTLGGLHPLL